MHEMRFNFCPCYNNLTLSDFKYNIILIYEFQVIIMTNAFINANQRSICSAKDFSQLSAKFCWQNKLTQAIGGFSHIKVPLYFMFSIF